MEYVSLVKIRWVIFLAVLGMVFLRPMSVGANTAGQIPNVQIASDHFMQSDTFLVKVIGEKNKVTGTFGVKKIVFFRSQDLKDWVAIVGVNIHKPPGIYKLAINVSGKSPVKKDITISKKDFPVTSLTITPQQVKQGYTVKKLLRNINNNASASLDAILGTFTSKHYFTKPFVNPLSQMQVTGDYGDIRENKGYKIQHLGTDLQADVNTPVYAINDGKVVFAKKLPDYGNTIVINHGLGIFSLYLHLASFKFPVGNMVKQKDVIALSGDTGYVLGPHLHFSIRVRGASVDPLAFLQATQNGW